MCKYLFWEAFILQDDLTLDSEVSESGAGTGKRWDEPSHALIHYFSSLMRATLHYDKRIHFVPQKA